MADKRIAGIEEHKVRTGESIKSLAESNGMTWQELALFNWGTAVPDEINKHLHDVVGCRKKTRDGRNYMFDSSDDPGLVYIPRKWEEDGLKTDQVHTIRVRQVGGFELLVVDQHENPLGGAKVRITQKGSEVLTTCLDPSGRTWVHGYQYKIGDPCHVHVDRHGCRVVYGGAGEEYLPDGGVLPDYDPGIAEEEEGGCGCDYKAPIDPKG